MFGAGDGSPPRIFDTWVDSQGHFRSEAGGSTWTLAKAVEAKSNFAPCIQVTAVAILVVAGLGLEAAKAAVRRHPAARLDRWWPPSLFERLAEVEVALLLRVTQPRLNQSPRMTKHAGLTQPATESYNC